VTPAWYHQLAREPGHFAVLDLPMQLESLNKQYMFYQTTHGKPLVEGRIARPPREAFVFLDSTPFLKRLRQDNVMDPALTDVTHQLQPLAEADVRYVILHKQFATSEQLAAWQDWLTFETYYEDEDLVVYRTDPRLGRDFTLVHEVTGEIGLIRVAFTPQATTQTGSIQVDARWGGIAAPGRDHDVCLKLVNAQGQVAQSDCTPLSLTWPTSRSLSPDRDVHVDLDAGGWNCQSRGGHPSRTGDVGGKGPASHLRPTKSSAPPARALGGGDTLTRL
jgi:hypothetical protein